MNNFMFIGGLLQEEIVKSLLKVCLAIDAIIYNLLTWLYGVFVTIAEARIFTSETVKPFLERIYLIIGIVALFFAAYTLVTLLINPDNLSNKSYSPTTVIRNVILSILAIVFVPTIFNFAYSVQGSIFKQNVIGKIFIDSDGKLADNKGNSFNEFSVMIFETSFYLVEENLDGDDDAALSCYNDAHGAAVDYNDITYYGECIDNVYSEPEKIHYSYFLSGIIGIVLVYVFLSYCIDVGIRCIKLALLQIIAPLPSLLLMVPGQDKAFKSWLKETLKTFFDVFVKMFILTFGVAMIRLVMDWFDSDPSILGNASKEITNFSKIFIFIGVCMFIKRAPKLLKDLFGFDLGENGISLRKRIDEFKDSIAPVRSFAGGAVGMAAGAYFGRKGALEGARARGATAAQTKFASATGLFHGARLGRKAGASGDFSQLGISYKYAKANQAAWAHMNPNNNPFKNWVSVQGEMLRDNFGFPSYYDSLVGTKEIEFNAKNSAYNRAIQNLDSGASATMHDIEKSKRFSIRSTANKVGIDAGKEIDTIAEEEVKKDGYTGTTHAIVMKKNQDGSVSFESTKIYGNQLEGLRRAYADARADGLISLDQEKKLTSELDDALKRLKSDFVTTNMLSNDRNNNWASSGGRDAALKRYKKDYVETMRASLEYTTAADDSVRAMLDQLYASEAEAKFNDIETKLDDYKANLNLVNKVNVYNNAMEFKGDSAIGVDENGNKVNTSIKASSLGSELFKSIKALKEAQSRLEYDQNEIYRNSPLKYINEYGKEETINLAQFNREKDRLLAESKKLTEEMKDFRLAHADEEQFAKIAQDQQKMKPKHVSKKNGNGH